MLDWKFILGAAVVGISIPTFLGGGDACRARNEAIVTLAPRILDVIGRDNPLFGAGRLLFNQKGEADEFAKGLLTLALKNEGDMLSCSLAYYRIKIAPDGTAQLLAAQIAR